MAHIVDSLFMHGSWLHVVDRPLHPPALSDEQRHAFRGAQGKLQDSSINFRDSHSDWQWVFIFNFDDEAPELHLVPLQIVVSVESSTRKLCPGSMISSDSNCNRDLLYWSACSRSFEKKNAQLNAGKIQNGVH